ncbi:MAG: methyltransferase domain-containing protein [Acidobacteria bacterium]|nr:methyltransferase domain-containing protein [Acidobacteriota bacterium]
MNLRLAYALLLSSLVVGIAPARAQSVIESNTPLRERDVIFVPTREPVANAMMKLANVTARDVVYDLGCGDGALVIAAAKLGARVVGVDIDPERIKEATANVRAAGVQDRVTLIRGDIFDPALKIGEASVVTLYLLQSLNQKLAPRLKAELKPGSRVVSHAFSMGQDWPPDQTEQADYTTIYLWTIR